MTRRLPWLGLMLLLAAVGCSDSNDGDGAALDGGAGDVDSGTQPDVDAGNTDVDASVDASQDLCPDDPDKTEPGACGCGVADDSTEDTDNDGDIDCVDTDDDGDGIDDADDSTPLDAKKCGDTDADGCEDCKSGESDPSKDGTDTDGDGVCDARDGVTYHFTTCGTVGMNGPNQEYCDSAYVSTPLEGRVTLDSGYQRFKVPSAGAYKIVARGAAGGTTNHEVLGGFGAEVSGVFTFKKNDELVIVVGQRGVDKPGCSDYGAGGGGGTFVTRKKSGGDLVNIREPVEVEPLLVAGGGGGASDDGQGCAAADQPQKKFNAKTADSGDGMGGVGADVGGGGGYLGDGNNDSTDGGKAFVNGALGSSDYQPGGFGGGSGGYNEGGNGGGYTGGSQHTGVNDTGLASGGTSFTSGDDASAKLRDALGDGEVLIVRIGGVDTDGDTVIDDVDTDSDDPKVCADTDADGCDDCAVKGVPTPKNDGKDTDKNGICDPSFTVKSTFEFGVCGGAGMDGPMQGDCDTAYTSTTLAGDVTVTAGYQRWTVPATGIYRITARGAKGGDANASEFGGNGAMISGLFSLTKNDELVMVVGQQGESQPTCADYGGAGGGASFVTMVMTGGDTVVPLTADVVPLLVAAGGAGASDEDSGCDGLQDPTVYAGSALTIGDGQGGLSEWGEGGGGGGYYGDGESNGGDGGLAFLNGATGASGTFDGGFGGGGGPYNGGGSGGGYTGGTTWGGYVQLGGYSFCDGVGMQGESGENEGDGSILIERLSE
jgi:Glycine rich protein